MPEFVQTVLKNKLFVGSQLLAGGGFALWLIQFQKNWLEAILYTLIFEFVIVLLYGVYLFIQSFIAELKLLVVEKFPAAGRQWAHWIIDRSPALIWRSGAWALDQLAAELAFLLPSFRQQYTRWLNREYDVFNSKGLINLPPYYLRLTEVFVDVRVNSSAYHANPQYSLMAETETDIEVASVWTFLQAKAFKDAALVIKGPPGSGKTTLLQYLALAMANRKRERGGIRLHFPLLLFLRDHKNEIVQAASASDNSATLTLAKLAQDYFSNAANTKDPKWKKPPVNWFERALTRRRCLVLLDGLDEVANEKERQIVAAWVSQQVRLYPKARFVVSSRPGGYMVAPLERAYEIEVLPFTYTQVQKFIDNWYLANGVMKSAAKRTKDVKLRAAAEAEDLARRLGKAPILQQLTANPLLLNIVVMVHSYTGALPGVRVELYDDICQVLLGKWQLTKGLQDNLRAEQKQRVLQKLAAYMMDRRMRDIQTYEALKVVTPILKEYELEDAKIANFLTDTQNGSGLLLEREANTWSFAHLTFQEYLTACEWLSENELPAYNGKVGNSWWHETLRLYVAKGDATPIVRACLAQADKSLEALTLMADCLEESLKLEQSLRTQAEQKIAQGLESDDKDIFKLAAEAKLAKRLTSFEMLSDNTEIDPELITHAEFQLFLDETQAQDNFDYPDHWNGLRFKSRQANSPAVGITFSAAKSFCKWLNERTGGTFEFRLPSKEEAEKNPVFNRSLAFRRAEPVTIAGQKFYFYDGTTNFSVDEENAIKTWLQ